MTQRASARQVGGISLRSVQRIWAARGLELHRERRFELSKDPAFATKLRDVVGLYLDLPAHSLVFSGARPHPARAAGSLHLSVRVVAAEALGRAW